MEKKFRQTIYIFKSISPIKKYSSFTYNEITWDKVNLLNFNREEIVKIEGLYFIYTRKVFYDSNIKLNSIVKFRHLEKIIKTIEIK